MYNRTCWRWFPLRFHALEEATQCSEIPERSNFGKKNSSCKTARLKNRHIFSKICYIHFISVVPYKSVYSQLFGPGWGLFRIFFFFYCAYSTNQRGQGWWHHIGGTGCWVCLAGNIAHLTNNLILFDETATATWRASLLKLIQWLHTW